MKLEDEKPKEKTEEDLRREAAFLKNRFESRYLTCPFNVGSFDVFTYVGKSMSQEFMEYAFEMDLLSLVTDWIRDADGNYWFLGVKSYMLTQEGYKKKLEKPSVLDRELMSLNHVRRPAKISCARCLYQYKVFDI